MLNRYLARVLVTSLVLATVPPSPMPIPACVSAHASPYSPRVIRRIRAMLALEVLESRRARLASAQAAVTRRITIDALLALPDDAAVLAQGPNAVQLKHLHARAASICW